MVQKALIHHVSGEMKSKQHRLGSPRNSHQRESTLYRSLVMKLAYVAQDRVDIAEAVKCLTRHERATKWTHARTQKVRSILGGRSGDVC